MKKHVLFIQGAGGYAEDKKLAVSLRDRLGAEYEVGYPRMPDENNPKYEAWKNRIAKELSELDGEVILAGHSFGASVLLKYLSEEKPKRPIAGAFLAETPYWGAEDWQVEEFALDENFARGLPKALPIFLYHSRDDEEVPFAHLELYRKKLLQATVRVLEGRNHQLNNDLSEVARDIRNLETQESDLPAGLAKPALRALHGAGIYKLEQLSKVSEAQLKKLHGMGPKALGVLRDALRARVWSFAETE